MGTLVREYICVSISTIGCRDKMARPEPKEPLREHENDIRQEKLPKRILRHAYLAHVTPILRFDPNFLECHHIVMGLRKAVRYCAQTLNTQFRKVLESPASKRHVPAIQCQNLERHRGDQHDRGSGNLHCTTECSTRRCYGTIPSCASHGYQAGKQRFCSS